MKTLAELHNTRVPRPSPDYPTEHEKITREKLDEKRKRREAEDFFLYSLRRGGGRIPDDDPEYGVNSLWALSDLFGYDLTHATPEVRARITGGKIPTRPEDLPRRNQAPISSLSDSDIKNELGLRQLYKMHK